MNGYLPWLLAGLAIVLVGGTLIYLRISQTESD
jgi:hypothetical protein